MPLTDKEKSIYKVTDTQILGFFDTHRYLSNFHLHPIEYEGIIYPSNENAYQAAKTFDKEKRLQIAAMTPNQSKSAGRSVSLREDWLFVSTKEEIITDREGPLITQVRDKIMYDINILKFQDPELQRMLLETGDKHLEETNWWRDNYWGVFNKEGLNKLGRILMRIREELRSVQKEAA